MFKVGGKIFAVLGLGGAFSIKVSDLAYEVLIETGQARPAPYLARAKWVSLVNPRVLTVAETKAYLRRAHAVIAGALPKKKQRELGL